MTPAPRKPIPVTILAAIRSSDTSPILEISVNIVAPKQIKITVRRPADLFLYSRSSPMTEPQPIDNSIAWTYSSCTNSMTSFHIRLIIYLIFPLQSIKNFGPQPNRTDNQQLYKIPAVYIYFFFCYKP